MKASGRVVFDTGALVSAALRDSAPADRALLLALRSALVCVCEQSVEKLRMALAKSSLDRYMRKRARAAFVDMLLRNAWDCPVSAAELAKSRPSRRDGRINLTLAFAAVADADWIVSIEDDLLARKAWRGIRIVTPAEFVDQFARS
jgi:predicted nucleic acid-binding protein